MYIVLLCRCVTEGEMTRQIELGTVVKVAKHLYAKMTYHDTTDPLLVKFPSQKEFYVIKFLTLFS